MRGGGLQTPSKWPQQLEGLPATTLPHPGALADGRTGMCQHLVGSLWCRGPAGTPLGPGVNPLPSTAPVAAACCRGAEPRSWRQ